MTDDDLIVVHTGETRSQLWNPLTHEEVHEETADGNIITTQRPKTDSAETV